MAVKVTRYVGSQNSSVVNNELKGEVHIAMGQTTECYTVQGVDDQYDALNAVDDITALAVPSIGDTYVKFGTIIEVETLEVINKSAEQEKANGIWRVYVTYDDVYRDWTPSEFESNIGKEIWNFRFGVSNQHIATIKKISDRKCYSYEYNGDTSVGGSAINDSNGDPEGIDIMIPSVALTVTKVFRSTSITPAFIHGIEALICTTNSAKFPEDGKYKETYGINDVLFVGCNINDNSSYNEDRSVGVSYDFLINPFDLSEDHDVFALDEDGALATISRTVTKNKGWDYKWVRTKKFTIPEVEYDEKSEQVLTADVLIDKVYKDASFTALGL